VTIAVQVVISDDSFRKAESFLTQLPLEMRNKVIPPALKAAGAPVAAKSRELAPSSAKTGTYKLWSKSMLRSRAGSPQHKDTIVVSSVRKYGVDGNVMRVYVGASWPAGNLINIIGHPHQQVLWGRRTGNQIAAVDYLERASAATFGEQQSAFVSRVESETAKILAKGANP